MNLNQIPAAAVLPIFIVLYILFWAGLLVILGRLSGWILLAQRYRATEPFEGKRWYLQHAQLRWGINYSGCLTVGANPTGLYLRIWPMFRPGHPALFIPWAETKIEMKRSFWMGNYMEMEFTQVPRTKIRFRERLAKKIATVVGEQTRS